MRIRGRDRDMESVTAEPFLIVKIRVAFAVVWAEEYNDLVRVFASIIVSDQKTGPGCRPLVEAVLAIETAHSLEGDGTLNPVNVVDGGVVEICRML